jgi:DNA modification methylase
MRELPAESVNTCVTSPPYFGLRDYGHEGQIGLEETPEAFVAQLVEVFREVKRVLRDDGTLWLNLGDSYARQAGDDSTKNPDSGLKTGRTGKAKELFQAGCNKPPKGLKPKDLIGIPWRVAFALQADGWYLRQDIIWSKPNLMPESVKDRCTKAHEYIFLLSKSPKYYFDSEGVMEDAVTKGKRPTLQERYAKGEPTRHGLQGAAFHGAGGFGVSENGKRNRRSVWNVTTKPYKGAHFATFPPDLIRPCILAGAPRGGTVIDPFGGSGTTAQVSIEEGRNAILCELNPEYEPLIWERVTKTVMKDFEI